MKSSMPPDQTSFDEKIMISPGEANEPWPTTFALETILGCNLRCIECAVGNDLISRKHGRLVFDQFKIIADKVRPYCRYFYLHLWGEPMLNKDIIEMIQYASGFSRTNISTAATTLNDDAIGSLMNSGVSDIIVSIDGVSQAVYEKYRVGGKVARALDALRKMQEINIRQGRKVNIMPQFILFDHNKDEAEEFSRYCRALGLEPLFKAPYIRKGSSLKVVDDPRYRRNIADTPEKRRENMRVCVNGHDVFTILLDGSVVACCHDHNGKTNFGNIFDKSVSEIWTSPAYRKFRVDLKDGKAWPFCVEECQVY